jgi:hypothetical protein
MPSSRNEASEAGGVETIKVHEAVAVAAKASPGATAVAFKQWKGPLESAMVVLGRLPKDQRLRSYGVLNSRQFKLARLPPEPRHCAPTTERTALIESVVGDKRTSPDESIEAESESAERSEIDSATVTSLDVNASVDVDDTAVNEAVDFDTDADDVETVAKSLKEDPDAAAAVEADANNVNVNALDSSISANADTDTDIEAGAVDAAATDAQKDSTHMPPPQRSPVSHESHMEERTSGSSLSRVPATPIRVAGPSSMESTPDMRLVVQARPSLDLVLEADTDTIFGRGNCKGCDKWPGPHIEINKPVMSHHHVVFRVCKDQLPTITDLDSKNGTSVNSCTLVADNPYFLRNGDRVRFGVYTTECISFTVRRLEYANHAIVWELHQHSGEEREAAGGIMMLVNGIDHSHMLPDAKLYELNVSEVLEDAGLSTFTQFQSAYENRLKICSFEGCCTYHQGDHVDARLLFIQKMYFYFSEIKKNQREEKLGFSSKSTPLSTRERQDRSWWDCAEKLSGLRVDQLMHDLWIHLNSNLLRERGDILYNRVRQLDNKGIALKHDLAVERRKEVFGAVSTQSLLTPFRAFCEISVVEKLKKRKLTANTQTKRPVMDPLYLQDQLRECHKMWMDISRDSLEKWQAYSDQFVLTLRQMRVNQTKRATEYKAINDELAKKGFDAVMPSVHIIPVMKEIKKEYELKQYITEHDKHMDIVDARDDDIVSACSHIDFARRVHNLRPWFGFVAADYGDFAFNMYDNVVNCNDKEFNWTFGHTRLQLDKYFREVLCPMLKTREMITIRINAMNYESIEIQQELMKIRDKEHEAYESWHLDKHDSTGCDDVVRINKNSKPFFAYRIDDKLDEARRHDSKQCISNSNMMFPQAAEDKKQLAATATGGVIQEEDVSDHATSSIGCSRAMVVSHLSRGDDMLKTLNFLNSYKRAKDEGNDDKDDDENDGKLQIQDDAWEMSAVGEGAEEESGEGPLLAGRFSSKSAYENSMVWVQMHPDFPGLPASYFGEFDARGLPHDTKGYIKLKDVEVKKRIVDRRNISLPHNTELKSCYQNTSFDTSYPNTPYTLWVREQTEVLRKHDLPEYCIHLWLTMNWVNLSCEVLDDLQKRSLQLLQPCYDDYMTLLKKVYPVGHTTYTNILVLLNHYDKYRVCMNSVMKQIKPLLTDHNELLEKLNEFLVVFPHVHAKTKQKGSTRTENTGKNSSKAPKSQKKRSTSGGDNDMTVLGKRKINASSAKHVSGKTGASSAEAARMLRKRKQQSKDQGGNKGGEATGSKGATAGVAKKTGKKKPRSTASSTSTAASSAAAAAPSETNDKGDLKYKYPDIPHQIVNGIKEYGVHFNGEFHYSSEAPKNCFFEIRQGVLVTCEVIDPETIKELGPVEEEGVEEEGVNKARTGVFIPNAKHGHKAVFLKCPCGTCNNQKAIKSRFQMLDHIRHTHKRYYKHVVVRGGGRKEKRVKKELPGEEKEREQQQHTPKKRRRKTVVHEASSEDDEEDTEQQQQQQQSPATLRKKTDSSSEKGEAKRRKTTDSSNDEQQEEDEEGEEGEGEEEEEEDESQMKDWEDRDIDKENGNAKDDDEDGTPDGTDGADKSYDDDDDSETVQPDPYWLTGDE